MKIVCPSCRADIPLDDVNVSTDVALCRRCKSHFSYSELLAASGAGEVDLQRPPTGTWFRRTPLGFAVGASTRSPEAFFLVPFMCVWSGISLGGIYGKQIASGIFDFASSLFGIPFLLGTLYFGTLAVMKVCGKVVVSVDRDEGAVFTGVGPIGWRQRFNWREVTTVRSNEGKIMLEGQRRIDLASLLNSERLYFILAALRRMRLERH